MKWFHCSEVSFRNTIVLAEPFPGMLQNNGFRKFWHPMLRMYSSFAFSSYPPQPFVVCNVTPDWWYPARQFVLVKDFKSFAVSSCRPNTQVKAFNCRVLSRCIVRRAHWKRKMVESLFQGSSREESGGIFKINIHTKLKSKPDNLNGEKSNAIHAVGLFLECTARNVSKAFNLKHLASS